VADLAKKKKAMAARQLLSPFFGEGVTEKKKAMTIVATVAFFWGVLQRKRCVVLQKRRKQW
jgi:hypothetical protein